MTFSRVALLALALIVTSGCLVLPKDISASTRPLEPGSYTELGEVTGSAWNIFAIALIVPFGAGPSDPAAVARDDALSKMGGDALIDVAMDQWIIMVPLPFVSFTLYRTAVHGTAVRVDKDVATALDDEPTLLTEVKQ